MSTLACRLIIIVLLGANFALLFGMLVNQPSHGVVSGPQRLPALSCGTYPLLCGMTL